MIRPLICLALAATLGAQAGPRWGGRGWRQGAGPIMTQLHQMRTQQIQQTLGIPEDRARAMADRWSQFDRDALARHRELRLVKQQINGILVGPGSDGEKSAKLRPLLDQFTRLRSQQQERRQAFESEIVAPLTPVQQARMVFLVEELQKSLREALREGRGGE